MYQRWWRVAAVGVENVPSHDHALLVANHAGRAPVGRGDDERRDPQAPSASAAPALHGSGLGVSPAVGERLHAPHRRSGRISVQRDPAARAGPPRDGLPGGIEGRGQAVLGAVPPAALRPRRLRRARAAHRRADRARRGRGIGGDLSEAGRVPPARAAHGRAVLSAHPDLPVAGRWPARYRCPRSGGSSSASRSTSRSTGPRRPTTARSCSSSPSASAKRSRRRSCRTWSRAARRSSSQRASLNAPPSIYFRQPHRAGQQTG